MRILGVVFAGTGIFLAGIGAIYWFTSYEPAGSILLVVGLGLAVLPGGSLIWWTTRMPTPVEDRPEADPSEGAGVVGMFPGSSVWPVVLAGGAAMTGIGLVFGLWAALPGVGFLLIAFVGATLESRGSH